MANEKKYILIKRQKTISYNEQDCFINYNPLAKENNDPSTSKEKAENQKKAFYNEFFKKHYKHTIVLTAAGTSLDNGGEETRGKTRDGLWTFCETEINSFEAKISDLKTKAFTNQKILKNYCLIYFFSKKSILQTRTEKNLKY